MRAVSKAEAEMSLSALFEQAKTEPILVQEESRELGVLVSIEEYRHILDIRRSEMDEIAQKASDRVTEHAEELGVSKQKLITELLRD